MRAHNWAVLAVAPAGAEIHYGPKVAHLQVPLFPWDDARLRELNIQILDGISIDPVSGGGVVTPSDRQLFIPDAEVLRECTLSGAGTKPVLDTNGQATDYCIDVTDIEAACNELFASLQQKVDLMVYKKQIDALENSIFQLRNGRRWYTQRRDHQPSFRGHWRSGGYSRGYRGGEADPQTTKPKN